VCRFDAALNLQAEPVSCPKPDIRDIFSDIWAAVKFDAYPIKFGLRAALSVTDELNLMFREFCSRVG